MRGGKIPAQAVHAALGLYRLVDDEVLDHWEDEGEAVICVKIDSELEMLDLQSKAELVGLKTFIVCDAGRTQIPEGSMTVLAIGPGPISVMNSITGHLKLL